LGGVGTERAGGFDMGISGCVLDDSGFLDIEVEI